MSIEEYKKKLEGLAKNKPVTINKKVSHLNVLEKQLQEKYPNQLFFFAEILEKLGDKYICEHIDKSTFKDKRGRKFALQDYIQIMELPYTYTIEFLKEGDFPKYVSEKKKTYFKYPELKELRKKFDTIEIKADNKQDRFLLSLLINCENVLRCDIANIKCNNYKTNEPRYIDSVIIFPAESTNKVKNYTEIIIKLNEEYLVETNKEYLIDIGGDVKNRCNNFVDKVKRLTKKYLDIELTTTDFRVIHTNNILEEEGITQDIALKIFNAKKRIEKNNHQFMTGLTTYSKHSHLFD